MISILGGEAGMPGFNPIRHGVFQTRTSTPTQGECAMTSVADRNQTAEFIHFRYVCFVLACWFWELLGATPAFLALIVSPKALWARRCRLFSEWAASMQSSAKEEFMDWCFVHFSVGLQMTQVKNTPICPVPDLDASIGLG